MSRPPPFQPLPPPKTPPVPPPGAVAPPRPPGRKTSGKFVPLSRPLMSDYLLMLLGFSLSLYLGLLSGLQPDFRAAESQFALALRGVLPLLIFLPIGVVLLWPIFFIFGKFAGRTQGLALGEWLWGLAWLVSLFVAGWICWKGSGSIPEGMASEDFKHTFFVAYVVYLLAMGGVAFVVWGICLFSSKLYPWTHTFALAVLFWPVVPLVLTLLLKWEMRFL